ncbi:MAG TPA: hypothetical protein VI653_15005 [Steroidobacteraceae bacterium]
MARKKKSTPEVEKVRNYVEGVAKSLVDRLYGPEGPPWGTKMTELEDVVVAVREVLSEKMLHQALERQAATAPPQRPPEYRSCPSCGRAVAPSPEQEGPCLEPRAMQTRGGEAQWAEPQEHCQKCRRSFFPSEQEPGD